MRKIGYWTVISEKIIKHGARREKRAIECVCICGKQKLVCIYAIKRGESKSCGCMKSGFPDHNMTGTKTYAIWQTMLNRCRNKNVVRYDRYGGRGIKVCKRWHRFVNFFEDMGECPHGFSIERIDNNGDYFKENCKWIPFGDQARNKSNNVKYFWKGKIRLLIEISEMENIPYKKLHWRTNKYGMTIDQAVTFKKYQKLPS